MGAAIAILLLAIHHPGVDVYFCLGIFEFTELSLLPNSGDFLTGVFI